ncbi:DUF3987 domain-containing protein [Micromonospora sp. NPDC049175]|uniref:DUF3987 domain-containing protein n=1 Tax=Micromonospora sp. NPDC049175 TaxID=3364266 RepID=UPI003719B45B
MTPAIDRVLDALRDTTGLVRQSGGQWQARCPAHEDRNPSLSVRAIEGSVLLHCHAGCDTLDVLAALDMTPRDLYDEPSGNELARYQYTDAAGRPTRTVHRLDGKRFTQSGDKRVPELYRLPRVVEAVNAGRVVYLVEGEKDVHAVESLGEVATTAPMGAANFGEVDVSPLRGAQVVAVVDRDAAGQKWAAQVVDRLNGYAGQLRLVEAATGKDAADHIAAGHTLDELRSVDVDEPWPTPIRVDEIDRTQLPEGADRYPAPLWAFVDAVTEALQVPREMLFLLVLSVLSTASGARWRVRVAPDWTETLALYVVAIMESGERKSASIKAAGGPLYRFEAAVRAERGPIIAEKRALRDLRTADVERLKREALKGKVDEAEYIKAVQALDEADVPAVPQLLADDVTPEKLGGLMSEQGGRMGVMSAEGGVFAILAGRYSGGQPNIDLFLKSHAGDPTRVDRTSRPPLDIPEPFLAVGLTIQPAILEGLAETRVFRGSGLLARFLYALPRTIMGRRNLDPSPVPVDVAEAYDRAVQRIAEVAWGTDYVAEMTLDADAAAVLRAYREEHEPRLDPEYGDLAHVADWGSKLPGHLVRIAALFTLFTNPHASLVTGEAMAAAVELEPYLVDHAKTAFDTIGGRRAKGARPAKMLAWIRRHGIERFTIRDALRGVQGQVWATDADAVREVVADLEDFGWVRRAPEPKRAGRGRPSERYDVNPAAHRSRRSTPDRADRNDKTPAERPSTPVSVISVTPIRGVTNEQRPPAPRVPTREEEWSA